MKKLTRLFLLLPLFGGIYALNAVETFPLYAGVGYGIARYVGDEITDPIYLPGQRVEGDRGYYEAYVGLDLGDILSVELGYAQFGEVKENFDFVSNAVANATQYDAEKVDFSRVSLMAVAEYPLTLGFSVYATGGYAYYDFDRSFYGNYELTANVLQERVSNGDHGLEYGFGAKWEIISRVSIRAQWSQSLIGDRKVQSNRLSVEFHL
jgi:opacity protein-like surface antigen